MMAIEVLPVTNKAVETTPRHRQRTLKQTLNDPRNVLTMYAINVVLLFIMTRCTEEID